MPVSTKDNGDGTFRIEYEPKSVGEYTASVFFADQEIPKSPVKINVQPSIDVSKVKVDGLDDSKFLKFFFPFDVVLFVYVLNRSNLISFCRWMDGFCENGNIL